MLKKTGYVINMDVIRDLIVYEFCYWNNVKCPFKIKIMNTAAGNRSIRAEFRLSDRSNQSSERVAYNLVLCLTRSEDKNILSVLILKVGAQFFLVFYYWVSEARQ